MASWMIHLRVAQAIWEQLQLRESEAFIMGNIAPDSGIPSPDGSGFVPDAAITHFRTIDENGLKDVHEEQFIGRYLKPEKRKAYTARDYAFYYGYLTHLLTDKLWTQRIAMDARTRFRALYEENRSAFWRRVKRDWYDLDFLFLRDYPDFAAWRTYAGIVTFDNDLLDFYARDAFMQRREHILKFYRDGVAHVERREMYLSVGELDVFVRDAVDEILRDTAVFARELTELERLDGQKQK